MSNPTTALERVHVTVCLKDVEIKKLQCFWNIGENGSERARLNRVVIR
jgi:hypothetical protein